MPNPSLGELFTQTWQKIDQMKLHVCLSGEYNVTTLVPTVDYPEENTFYLVPDGTGNNVYTEWVYVNDNWERFGQASIDLSDYVQKTDYANSSTAGVIKIGTTNTGLYLNPTSGTLFTSPAGVDELKAGTNTNKPIVPAYEDKAVFYGLAKAAGDTTQALSDNAVGTYTSDAKAAIQSMLGLDIADQYGTPGLVKLDAALGITVDATTHKLFVDDASDTQVKTGTEAYKPITPRIQHNAVFYGLAKAAGDSTQAASNNAVGTYTDNAKTAIKNMLGVEDNFTRNSINRIVPLGTIDIDGTEKTTTLYVKLLEEGTAQLVIGSDETTIHLTKSTANDKTYYTSTETLQDGVTPIITLYHDSSEALSTTITYQVASDTTYSESQEVKLSYPSYSVSTEGILALIKSPKTGYLVKLVSTEDIANDTVPGVVKVNAGHGIAIDSDGVLQLTTPTTSQLQALSNGWLAPRLNTMHTATFYSLAKAAGDTTQSISNNAVGLYTDNAKIAIQKMLGIYDAPWELIKEDTFTNAELAEHVIDTDSNGDAFNLTDVVVQITIKKDVAMEIGNYGKIEFYYDATHSKNLLIGVTSGTKTKDWYASATILRNSNSMMAFTSVYSESGNARTVQVRNDDTLINSIQNFEKIRFTSIKGSFTVKVYGKREWRI